MARRMGYFNMGNEEDEEEDFGARRANIRRSIRDLDELDAERNLSDVRESEYQRMQEAELLVNDLGRRQGPQLGAGNAQEHLRRFLSPSVPSEMRQHASHYGEYRGDGLNDFFTYQTYVTPLESKNYLSFATWNSAGWESSGRINTSHARYRKKEFLMKSYKPYDNDEFWQGKKVLGEGGQGLVGLWECVDPRTGHTSRIAVKESMYFDLKGELRVMYDLQNRGGHCVQLVGQQAESDNDFAEDSVSAGKGDCNGDGKKATAPIVVDGDSVSAGKGDGKKPTAPIVIHDSVSASGDDDDERRVPILMEFCEGGTLSTRIKEAKKSETPFEERVVWKIFKCLIKGLNMMEHGTETKTPGADGPVPETGSPWQPITHFDIKPHNILLTTLDEEHDIFPRCKIGDFGLAERLPSIEMQLQKPTDRMKYRECGTRGYKAPEQFSRRWQFGHWQTNKELTFGTHTNIWMLGVVMYQLCTLRGPPKPKESVCGDQPGLTYGPGLKYTEYSKKLKNLIWGCLAEKPSMRPTLEYCGTQIEEALTTANVLPMPPPVEREEPTERKPPVSDDSVVFLESMRARRARPEEERPVKSRQGKSKRKPTAESRHGKPKEKPLPVDESIEFLASNKARCEERPAAESRQGKSKEKPTAQSRRGKSKEKAHASNDRIEFLASNKARRKERPPGGESSVEFLGVNVVRNEKAERAPPPAGNNKRKRGSNEEPEDKQDRPKPKARRGRPKKVRGDPPPGPPPGPSPGAPYKPRRSGLRPRPLGRGQG